MDILMKDADSGSKTVTSDPDMDMNMSIDEAHTLRPGHVRRNPNIINLASDDENASDNTLLGDQIIERATLTPSNAFRRRHQSRNQSARHRELHSHSSDSRTFRAGKSFRRHDRHFLRVTSITQHQGSGCVAAETIQENHREVDTYSYDGRTLKPTKTVELTDGTFLRIKAILEDRRTGEILLKGFLFQRTRLLKGLLEFKRNEVAMILTIDKDDTRDILEQSVLVVGLTAVARVRELVKTNQQFPALSFRETDPESIRIGKEHVSDYGRLVCRWNYLKTEKNEGLLRRITDVESDEGCSVPQDLLRYSYRGPTTKGGDCPEWLDGEEAFRLRERARCDFIDP